MPKGNRYFGSPVAIATSLAFLTTIIAIASGALRNSSTLDRTPELLHYSLTYLMLGSYIALILTLLRQRSRQPQPLEISVFGEFIKVSPCTQDEVWTPDQEELEGFLRQIRSPSFKAKGKTYRVAILEGMIIPQEIANLWTAFPNLKVLDVQKSQLPDNFWTGLERCQELDDVLTHGATYQATDKEIYMTIPEIRIHNSPTTVLV